MKVLSKRRGLGLLLLSFLCISCQKEFDVVFEVYRTNFELDESDLELTNQQYIDFDNSRMIGNYHDGGFEFHQIDLPSHSFIRVVFDLYILDSWDGNNMDAGGPDRWFMVSRRKWKIDQISQGDFEFETTFSNAGDPSRYDCFQEIGCKLQSYPGAYPSFNFPRTGAAEEFFGLCGKADLENGAMRYRVSQTFPHEHSEIHLFFYDSLVQDNAFSEPCDESWAMDNLRIFAIDEI